MDCEDGARSSFERVGHRPGMTDQMQRPDGYVFAVGDKPYCCWDYDHAGRNLEFLRGIDTNYFEVLGRLLQEHITSGSATSASIALRAVYHQGIEALMSLLGALAQAPGCVPTWIAKCSTQDLQEVVRRLTSGRSLLTQQGELHITLTGLSERAHRYAWLEESGSETTASRFARCWQRFAREFLDETARAEHNA